MWIRRYLDGDRSFEVLKCGGLHLVVTQVVPAGGGADEESSCTVRHANQALGKVWSLCSLSVYDVFNCKVLKFHLPSLSCFLGAVLRTGSLSVYDVLRCKVLKRKALLPWKSVFTRAIPIPVFIRWHLDVVNISNFCLYLRRPAYLFFTFADPHQPQRQRQRGQYPGALLPSPEAGQTTLMTLPATCPPAAARTAPWIFWLLHVQHSEQGKNEKGWPTMQLLLHSILSQYT